MVAPVWIAPSLVTTWIPIKADDREVICLAENIYHEARSESINGQVAVAQVTLNRVKSKAFKSSICGVVYEKAQFSWTLNKFTKIKDLKAWEHSKILAKAVLDGYARIPHFNALYYHTKSIKPYWIKDKTVIATIGAHVFYL